MNPKQPRRESSVKTILATLVIFMFVIILMSCTGGGVPATEFPPAVAVPENNQAPAATEAPNVSGETADSGIPVTTCDVLLPPEACNPEWESQIVYTPLINLPTVDCEKRLLNDTEGTCIGLAYTNNNQDFTITVEGSKPETVMEYINTSQAYFIVQQVGGGITPPNDLNLPSLPTILVEIAVRYTKLTQAELSAERDRIVSERGVEEGQYVTLADVLFSVSNGDSTIVDNTLKDAETIASDEYIAAGTTAGLGQAEIDNLTNPVLGELEALMYEPGASFLFDPATLPIDETEQRNALINNPDALLITMEWKGAPAEDTGELWTVWYSIDPRLYAAPVSYAGTQIAATAVHSYMEKCKVTSASVRIQAVVGSMTNYFWRAVPTKFVGSRVADIKKTPAPSGMTHSSAPSTAKYDIKVVGGSAGGNYYLYGGWVQGSGCQ